MSANASDSSSASHLSILLIEPSEVQRKVITRHLKSAGVEQIEGVGSIAEAKQKLTYANPDLVASAMYFSDGTADDLLDFMFSHNHLRDIPFMLVSSEHKRNYLEQYKQAGVVAILPKPFTIDHLQRALNATIDLIEPQTLQLKNFETEDLHVLVVDDSTTSRHYLTRVLNSIGVEAVAEAESGDQAIAYLSEHSVDLIVTDYHMPNMNGDEFASRVRAQLHDAHVPILMVSARADELTLEQIEQAGVNALSDKPFEPATLRALLSRILDI